MFNLIEAIVNYNQTNQIKIKPNKTWGLAYLQSEGLAVLNNCEQLTEKSVYHASHFVTDRKALRMALARAKHQSPAAILDYRLLVQQTLFFHQDQSCFER